MEKPNRLKTVSAGGWQDRWARLQGGDLSDPAAVQGSMVALSLFILHFRKTSSFARGHSQADCFAHCTWMGCQHKWTPLRPPQKVQLQVAWSFSSLTMRADGVFCRLRWADTNNPPPLLLSQRPSHCCLCLLQCFPFSWRPNSIISPVMMWLWDAEGCNYVLSGSGGQRVQ